MRPVQKTLAMLWWSIRAGDDLGAVHARLDDLQGNSAVDRSILLRHIDDAEAAYGQITRTNGKPFS
jgi:hypothetical protein